MEKSNELRRYESQILWYEVSPYPTEIPNNFSRRIAWKKAGGLDLWIIRRTW